MSLSTVNQTVALLARLLNMRKSTIPVLPTQPQKPPCSVEKTAQAFERVTPESQGISSAHIASFLEALRRDTSLNMHSLLLLRNGKVLAEVSFGAQDTHVWKMTFSACKSITALAVGMLIDEGKLSLDDHVVDFFPDKTTPVMRLRFKDITIRHLLTMTSGVSFNEAESMTQTDWVHAFFSANNAGKAAKTFSYNSMNTYMLAAVIVRVTGESLTEFLRPRLWEPLGITRVFWETCPEGIEKGGWGLYLSAEDMAKIGQLVLQRGCWNGQQLISAAWIENATAFHVEVPEDCGDFNYGYQFWCGRQGCSFLFNGMLGQNVWGFPDSGILLVTNAGNDELFQQSNYFRLAQEYFDCEFADALPENPEDQERLKTVIENCRYMPQQPVCHPWWQFWKEPPLPLPSECYDWNGTTLHAVSANAASVGLLPVLLQATQNNYASGLLELRFEIVDDRFLMTYSETGEAHQFAVGFDQPQITELYFHGEPYRVAVRGRFATNEDDETVLVVTMDFLETPCTRTLKVIFGKGKMALRQTERPGEPFFRQLLAEVKQRLDSKPLLGAAVDKLDDGYVLYKIGAMLSPEVELQ